MTDRTPIPTPLPLQWQRLRSRALPPLCFVLSVALSAWLWQQQTSLPNAVGEVEAIRVDVSSLSDGQLVPLSDRVAGDWGIFDRVQAGQTLARVDSRVVWTELSALDVRLASLAERLASPQSLPIPESTVASPSAGKAADTALRIEQQQIARLYHRVRLQLNQIQQYRLRLPDPSPRDGVATEGAGSPAAKRDQLLAERSVHERAIKALDEELDRLRQAAQLASPVGTTAPAWLINLRPAITELTVRAEQACVQAQALEVRAPLGGTIVAIHCWRGQIVRAGDPLVTIAADQSRHVLSYLSEDQRVIPRVGTQVSLWPRTVRTGPVLTVVESVGPQVERIPPHHLPNPDRQQWGLPVRIRLPSDLPVRPGALLDVKFSTRTASAPP